MSKADELREKARRLEQQRQRAESNTRRTSNEVEHAGTSRPAPSMVASPKAKPIRSTVDLAPTRHASLKSWCGETAVELGVSRVTTQDVMRTLVARLLTDETLARKIRADLRADLA